MDRLDRIRHLPAMRFHMAIREGKIRAPVMVRARHVAPGILLETINEKAVVKSVGLLVQEDKSFGGSFELGFLEELNVKGVKAIGEFTGIANHSVHRNAADAVAVGRGLAVRGTLVNTRRMTGKRAQF